LPEKKIKKRKKFYFFGPIIEIEYYEEIYQRVYDIESCDYTKVDVKEDLEKRHTQYVRLLSRCEEIKNGQII